MSHQSNLDRFKEIQINRKESIGVLIGAAAGLILGLLIGWVWWPVEWQGGTLDAVGRTTQVEYVSAVADGYAAYSTQEALDLARQRLASLSGDALPALFDEALTLYGAQPNGGQQVANLAALASALGVAVTALPTAPPAVVEAAPATTAPAGAAASNESSSGDGNGFWSALQFLVGVLMLGGGAYLGWLLFKRLRPAARPAPAIGPLGPPATGNPPGTAYEAPARPAPPAYTAAQAAATKVQPVQPPAMGNVPPFEPEEAGGGSATQVRSSGQPIAPSVAVPPTPTSTPTPSPAVTAPVAPGAFVDDDEEETISPGQAAAATAAVGQRPGAAATGWVAGAGRIDRYPTLDRLDARFTAGLPDFHITHNIAESADGAYLGEYGVGVSDRYGMLNNDPDQVVAIEVYIFDKSDEKNLVNVNRVILSEYADAKLRKHFEREKDRLGPIVAQPKTTLQLEARQFLLICTITDVRYSAEGIFERLDMALELKKKV